MCCLTEDMVELHVTPPKSQGATHVQCSHRLLSAASSTFGAFVIGAVGSIVGTIVAWLVLGPRLGPDGYKVSSPCCLFSPCCSCCVVLLAWKSGLALAALLTNNSGCSVYGLCPYRRHACVCTTLCECECCFTCWMTVIDVITISKLLTKRKHG